MKQSLATLPAPEAKKGIGMASLMMLAIGIYGASSIIAFGIREISGDLLKVYDWIGTLALQGSMLVLALFVSQLTGVSAQDMGCRWPDARKGVISSLLVPGFLASLIAVVGVLLDLKGRPGQAPTSLFEKVVWWCIFSSIAEEIYIRGWFQAMLQRVLNGTRAVVFASAGFFAVLHFGEVLRGLPMETALFRIFYALWLGYLCAKVRVSTGSIIPAIAVHFVWNLVGVSTWPVLRIIFA